MQALVGDRTGEAFRIGDTVKVRLLEAARNEGGALIVHGWTMAEDLVKLGAR